MTVKEIMTRSVISVRREDTIRDVARLLTDFRVSGLPVIDGQNRVVGMITEGDLIRFARTSQIPVILDMLGNGVYLNYEPPASLEEQVAGVMGLKVSEVMIKRVTVIGPDAPVEEVAQIMVNRRIKRLPVVDKDNKLVGIVSRGDIVRSVMTF
ncbi:MAG TPA: CBS domain-containing protein [Bacillota bacterium]|jgi:CBS domain-containing protein